MFSRLITALWHWFHTDTTFAMVNWWAHHELCNTTRWFALVPQSLIDTTMHRRSHCRCTAPYRPCRNAKMIDHDRTFFKIFWTFPCKVREPKMPSIIDSRLICSWIDPSVSRFQTVSLVGYSLSTLTCLHPLDGIAVSSFIVGTSTSIHCREISERRPISLPYRGNVRRNARSKRQRPSPLITSLVPSPFRIATIRSAMPSTG